jgi:hypothetical protein
MGINFFVADYRGYGSSGGRPTISGIIKDAHPIFKGFKEFLRDKGFLGNIFIMGRSLGSASAIELAYHYQDEFKGLIIESGFADILRLFSHLGLKPGQVKVKEGPLDHVQRIKAITIPSLFIVAQYDFLVPPDEGKELYNNSAAKDKRIVIIPNADHNTIFFFGMHQYMQAIKEFIFSHSPPLAHQ